MGVDWEILWHPLFEERFMGLLERVEDCDGPDYSINANTDPADYDHGQQGSEL